MGLSSVWLGELYRLVTTYNVLGKAGYKLDGDSNRALIDLLSDNVSMADQEPGDKPFIHIEGLARVLPAKKEGMKFARRVLVTAWDSVLEVLSLPLETSTTGENSDSNKTTITVVIIIIIIIMRKCRDYTF